MSMPQSTTGRKALQGNSGSVSSIVSISYAIIQEQQELPPTRSPTRAVKKKDVPHAAFAEKSVPSGCRELCFTSKNTSSRNMAYFFMIIRGFFLHAIVNRLTKMMDEHPMRQR